MAASGGQTFTINGVRVQFPHKPYPSQFSMMDKIIKGIEKGQNCLLESPTGSGKSLALLCSALAWQRAEREKIYAEEKANEKASKSCPMCGEVELMDTGIPEELGYPSLNKPEPPAPEPAACKDIEDDDFKIDKRTFRTPQSGKIAVGSSKADQGDSSPGQSTTDEKTWTMEVKSKKICTCSNEQKPTRKVPKIWFGTRTHKQIAQIARELGKTDYRGVRMSILSSREHTCIHPKISKSSHKNEECKSLLEHSSCKFNENVRRRISHRALKDGPLDNAWDLEEFVEYCQGVKACPYFGTRQLKDGAEIIFCPYNYLIDPIIRESMEIILKDQIVILDEAHNIEDSAREAASYSCTAHDITEADLDLNQLLIRKEGDAVEYRMLRDMLMGLAQVILQNQHYVKARSFEQGSKVWTGMDMVAMLKAAFIDEERLKTIKKQYQKLVAEQTDPEKRNEIYKLKSNTLKLLEGLVIVLDFVFRENMRYKNDYRIALLKTTIFTQPQHQQTENVWLFKAQGRNRGGRATPTETLMLHFWCLNPAVAFREMGSEVRSIILTSGTLSPMSTFQSELGTDFPIQLEASHVVGKSQVWVGTIAKGPRGCGLLGNYQTSETFAYQDDLGELVLGVCETVPHGVLCFLPSYKTLDKLKRRWQTTGLYDRLELKKIVMCEPKASERVDFDELLRSFYEAIEASENMDENEAGQTGALFLAVCRGKVSEGMDFSDNNARAVITVGIPYPNVKDEQVGLKKEYNNRYSHERGLLSGNEWYEIQAFRALNQALGRCIRHRNDWGALILVDERYSKNPSKYTKGLSKWVRQRVHNNRTYLEARQSLRFFIEERAKQPATHDVSVLNQSVLASTSTASPAFKTPLKDPAATPNIATNLNRSNFPSAVEISASPSLERKESLKRDIDQTFGGGFLLPSQNTDTNSQSEKSVENGGLSNFPSETRQNSAQNITKPSKHVAQIETFRESPKSKIFPQSKEQDQVDDQEGFIDISEEDFQPSDSSTQIPGKGRKTVKRQSSTKRGSVQIASSQQFGITCSQGSKGVLDFTSPVVEKKPERKLSLKEKLSRFSFPPSAQSDMPKLVTANERKSAESSDFFTNTSSASNAQHSKGIQDTNELNKVCDPHRSESPDMFDSDSEQTTERMTCDSELDKVIRDVKTEIETKGNLAKNGTNNDVSSRTLKIESNDVTTHKNKSELQSNDLCDTTNKRETRTLLGKDIKIEVVDKTEPKNEKDACDNSTSTATENKTVKTRRNSVTKLENKKKQTTSQKLKQIKATQNDKISELEPRSNTIKTMFAAVAQENVKKETQEKSNLAEEVTKENNDKSQEELKTRRSKRRRPLGDLSASKKRRAARGVVYNEDPQPKLTVSCTECKEQLYNNIPESKLPDDIPPFVQKQCKNAQPVFLHDASANTIKVNRLQLRLNQEFPVTSYFSESEGCCYRYVCCKCGPCVVGVEVKLLAEAHHKSLSLNQVWLFPHLVTLNHQPEQER